MPKPTPAPGRPVKRATEVEMKPARAKEGAGVKEAASPAETAVKPRRPSRSRGFESFEEALAYLTDRVNLERANQRKLDPAVFKLERMRALMAALGDPQSQIKTVHVAGSKGKGSTCEMIASCLQACGYATGLYTSPHLVDLRERIRINDNMIPEEDFRALMSEIAAQVPKVEKELGHPTYFELITALGFLHFARQAVDIAVIEVGLGGRLDSTNIITPEVAVITAIQLEHTHLLGDTLEKVAGEKAGIMKRGVTTITVAQAPGVVETFRQVAEPLQAPLLVLGKDIDFSYRFEASPELGPHARVCLTTARSNYEHLPVPLKGEHQALNCGLALAVLDRLREHGFETPERSVGIGLARTPNHGRLEQVWDRPRIIVDGAHNPESIHGLVKAIGAHIRYDSMVVIFGCASDKNVPGMLAKIALGADKIIFTKASGNPRSMDPRELQRRFAEVSSKMTQTAPSLKEAINLAARAVARDDLICITGSFYLAGEAKRLLAEKRAAMGTA
ncbi:MAG: bifunctional folylpolyglutamate synthase/dihydrofolate synthase [Phycisphaerales bacterium]|nr:bifunctional folylpolyglutamate synthase/dihydrofolate synthase [Phycisphaerales bacterium]